MRNAQRAFAGFLPFIDWGRFRRRNCSDEVRTSSVQVASFYCACEEQAVLWLLRRDTILPSGRLDPEAEPVSLEVTLPPMRRGNYRLLAWDTFRGLPVSEWEHAHGGGPMRFRTPPFRADMAIGVKLQ
jgi:mannan endo-1,4-beta-mannosidase